MAYFTFSTISSFAHSEDDQPQNQQHRTSARQQGEQQQDYEPARAQPAARNTARHFLNMLRVDLEGTLQETMPLLFQYPDQPVSVIFAQLDLAQQVEAGMERLQRAAGPLQHPQPRKPRCGLLSHTEQSCVCFSFPPTPASTTSRPSTASSHALTSSRQTSRASSTLPRRREVPEGQRPSSRHGSIPAIAHPSPVPDTQGKASYGSFDRPASNNGIPNGPVIDLTDADDDDGTRLGRGSYSRGTKRTRDEKTHDDDDDAEEDPSIAPELHRARPRYMTSAGSSRASSIGESKRPQKSQKPIPERFDRPVQEKQKSTPSFAKAPPKEGVSILNGHIVHLDKHGIWRRGKGTKETLDCMPSKMALLEAHGTFARDHEPVSNRDDLVGYAVDEERARNLEFAQGDRKMQISKANNCYVDRKKAAIDGFFKPIRAAGHTPSETIDVDAEEKSFRRYTFEVCHAKPLQWKPKGMLRKFMSVAALQERDRAFDYQRHLSLSVSEGHSVVQDKRFPQLMVPISDEEQFEMQGAAPGGPGEASYGLIEGLDAGDDDEAQDEVGSVYNPGVEGQGAWAGDSGDDRHQHSTAGTFAEELSGASLTMNGGQQPAMAAYPPWMPLANDTPTIIRGQSSPRPVDNDTSAIAGKYDDSTQYPSSNTLEQLPSLANQGFDPSINGSSTANYHSWPLGSFSDQPELYPRLPEDGDAYGVSDGLDYGAAWNAMDEIVQGVWDDGLDPLSK